MNNKSTNKPEDEIYLEDEIDLREILSALWSNKISIIIITTIFAISSVFFSLSVPNIYTSQALLAPSDQTESLKTKLGGFAALTGFGGVQLPSESGGKAEEAIERLKSYDFFVNEFLPFIKFENLVAAKDWNQDSQIITYDEKIFSNSDAKWSSIEEKPSKQEAFKKYSSILAISENKKNPFVLLTIEHVSPFIAERWLELIIKNINNHMRELDKIAAKNSIEFLSLSTQKTNLSQIKGAISKLLETQIQILMIAEANADYVFKPLASPLAPENKSKPSRARICIIGTLLGFFFSILLSLFLYYFKSKKT